VNPLPKWVVWWTLLGLLLLGACCVWGGGPPPLPLTKANWNKRPFPTQGAGAAALIRKAVVIPPKPFTNHLTLSCASPTWCLGDQPFPGMFIFYCGEEKRLLTNYWEWLAKWPGTGWQVLGVTNHGTWTVLTTNRNGLFRCRCFLA
jgi:hypothetical protein